MQNILITSVGRRVSLVKAFQVTLQRYFSSAKVFGTDNNIRWSAACQVCDKAFQVSKVQEDTYIEELLNICLQNNVGMIIPTIDTELLFLSRNKELFAARGIHIVVSDVNLVEKCRDKRRTNDLFKDLDIATPKPIKLSDGEFPIFAKPYNGSLSKGIVLIRNEEDLTDGIVSNPDLMFMEYLDPDNFQEFTVDGYFDRNSQLKCLVPRKRVEVRGGEVSKAITQKGSLYSFLLEKCSYIPGAIGCLTMQFFEHRENGSIYAIEINPRFGGGYPLSFQAGANFPEFLIQEYFLNSSITFHESWEDALVMLRYDQEVILRSGDGTK